MSRSDPAGRLASILPEDRLGTFRVPGLPGDAERLLAAPVGDAEWSETLAAARSEGFTVLLVGRGSKLSWCPPPEAVDLVLTTREDRGVTAYEPEDGTLTARAGTAMEELARTVAAGGHHLTPDVPTPATATLGGTVAAAAPGFDRLRHGPVRHTVLGLRLGLADGSLVKSGGALVKNVTGYDLHRLFTGSHGTLGCILEASLRLHPAPGEEVHLSTSFEDREGSLAAASELLALPVRPIAVVARGGRAGPSRLDVALAGRREVVDWEADRVRSVLPAVEERRGEDARGLREELRDSLHDGDRWPAIELTCLPSRLAGHMSEFTEAARKLGLEWHESLHPGIASAWIRLDGEICLEAARGLEDGLAGSGARVVWRAAPAELAREIDVFGPPSPGLPLMRRLKDALDPDGVFARGRFHGRI